MIQLSSEVFTIKKIKTKTRAEGFKEMREGDQLRFRMKLSNTTSYGSGNYATSIEITDLKRRKTFFKSQSNLSNILQNFELEAVEQPAAAEVLGDLYDTVQEMRETGDTDLRTVLYHIEKAAEVVR